MQENFSEESVDDKPGKVYILTNQAMPGYIKIGKTFAEDVETRMKGLDRSGVPLPFECYYAAAVPDADALEKSLHSAFEDVRARSNREFFKLDPHRARVIIKLLEIEDVTPREQVVSEPGDAEALVKSASKAGRFRFSIADVPVGATLTFSRDEARTAVVLDDNNIEFEGQVTSLSRSALEIMHELGYDWKTVDGTSFWLYEGQTLKERRREIEEQDEENELSGQ
jgi:hypothetical protein